jgi:hypothetical protein
VIIKPSRYSADGFVERFRWGFMPNSTVPHMVSMTPRELHGCAIETQVVDEYVRTDLDYLDLLNGEVRTLVALVGVQSQQIQRALDLAAFAREHGAMAVIGGPHAMTCDTTEVQGRGISFSLSEAELVWRQILSDAIEHGELESVYDGGGRRWQEELEPVVLRPPSKRDLARYVIPMLGVYPARGCPYKCSFCSIIKIAGHRVRSQPIETTLASLRAAKAAGVRLIMITSDNFNKYPEAYELLQAMAEERIDLPFFVQCDAEIADQEEFVAQLARAGCFQIFVGVESFDRKVLKGVNKNHNDPTRYARIVEHCKRHGISSHFSNIIGFPEQTESSITEHLAELRAVAPDQASFYVLTPTPGTEQWAEYMDKDLLTERNLDAMDSTRLTWRHPHLRGEQLQDLVFRCYREFYSPREIARRVPFWLQRNGSIHFGNAVMSNWNARRRKHPMSGGLVRVTRDRDRHYRELRQRTYGLDRMSLPRNLVLSEHDERLNRLAKLRLPRQQQKSSAGGGR